MPHSFDGTPTQVLVLGTAHLNHEMPDAALRPTLRRLTDWQPDAVAVELLAGEVIQGYRAEGGSYADLRWGGFSSALQLEAEARQHRSWTRVEAEALALHPATPPAERALAWLVALEPANALLTWTPDLDLPGNVASAFARYAAHPSEVHRLAVPVARALDHPRLHHFDDFTDTRIERQIEALRQLWDSPEFQVAVRQHPLMLRGPEKLRQAADTDYWEYLRFVNSPETVEESLDLEVGLYLRHPLPGGEPRSRVADWDTRNLFMAARLRMVTAHSPGGRVLALVGHGHKGPLEKAILALAPDVRLVALEELEA